MSGTQNFTGIPEFWFNQKENLIVIRCNKNRCELLDLNNLDSNWNNVFFKEKYSFEFINGSKYLTEKGFELICKI